MTDPSSEQIPREPIHRLTGPLERFLHVEAASGAVLLACAATALGFANSGMADAYLSIWKTPFTLGLGDFQMSHSLKHWINDGLMAVFFFVVGLEVKRELVLGELREMRRAMLPLAAAIGGMVVPAGVYLALQGDGPAARGWGIPMATDIAFVVGCLAVLGSRIPPGLRVMVLSLAIVDDIGAILVIAIGYTASIDGVALALGVVGLIAVAALARLGVRSFGVYAVLGFGTWVAFHESGVHATIAGVALGLMTPARSYLASEAFAFAIDRASDVLHGGDWDAEADRGARVRRLQWFARESVSPLEYLEGMLHPWVAFGIMPVFALANAGVAFSASDLVDPVALAIAAGLVVGKPVGIVLASAIVVKLGVARLPEGVGWTAIAGGGMLAGIGFTMALFIAGLALEGPALGPAKFGILAGSVVSAIGGLGLLVRALPARAD